MRTATFKSIEGDIYTKLSAAIRNSGSGWHVIDDPAHEPLGISIGVVTTTNIEILFPEGVQVCDMVVGPDETFAKPPYKATFGASVGLYRAFICGTVSGVTFNPSTWVSSSANIWISGWMLMAEAPAAC